MSRMLVLVGLPGSGKSTFSKALEQYYPEWRRVNQDDLKSRKNCEHHTKKYFRAGCNVIVDRCNFDASQRRTWIELAKAFGARVDCIVLTADSEICSDRILVREDHPTGVTGDKGVGVLRKFIQNYQLPQDDEGFNRVLYLDPSPNPICSRDRVDHVLSLLYDPVQEQEEERQDIPTSSVA